MIIDSSAVAAICLGEPGAEILVDVIEGSTALRMSAASFVEAGIVIDKRSPGAFDQFVEGTDLEVVSLDREQAEVARQAYLAYGKGSGHAAQLNFGDCFSYALAVTKGETLLFKGNDFHYTDVASALKL